jgi:hypothetical protein
LTHNPEVAGSNPVPATRQNAFGGNLSGGVFVPLVTIVGELLAVGTLSRAPLILSPEGPSFGVLHEDSCQAGYGVASRAALRAAAHQASWSSRVLAYPGASGSSGRPSCHAVKGPMSGWGSARLSAAPQRCW